jgi:hypothetical protein
MTPKTTYQQTHDPRRVEQVKCTETGRDDPGFCVLCRRFLKRRGPHNPNAYGALGVIEHYGDDSTRTLSAAEA